MRLLWFAIFLFYSSVGETVIAAQSTQQLWILNYHDVRDRVEHTDDDIFAISTQNLVTHFSWLRTHGYHPITIDDLLAATRGEKPLPAKAVLLSFDDGYASFYSHVFPLLTLFNYPAIMALVGSWLEISAGAQVNYGGQLRPREDFLSWQQAREMQASGLIEFASHSYDLHRGVMANPQGNEQPAAVARQYLSKQHRYETEAEQRQRIHTDLSRNSALMQRQLDITPRIMVWPFGLYSQAGLDSAAQLGMPITFTLNAGPAQLNQLNALPRHLFSNNATLTDVVGMLRPVNYQPGLRAVQVTLDTVYHPDLEQQQRNLDALIERINRLQINTIFVQSCTDADGDGVIDSTYFPNRHLPLRADLMNHVTWQLKTRAATSVYARLPLLDFDLPETSPKSQQAQQSIQEIYQDLAAYVPIDGILFDHAAPTTTSLIEYSLQLYDVARAYRPALKTARNLYSNSKLLIKQKTDSKFSQILTEFSTSYDYVVLRAPPATETVSQLLNKLIYTPSALDNTIVMLSTYDRHNGTPVATTQLAKQIHLLLRNGVHHVGYSPDDFSYNHPALRIIYPAISSNDYPPKASLR